MIVIIQARSSSKRFPKKVLFKIKKKLLIDHVISRVRLSKKIKKIIVSTSSHKSDNELTSHLKKNRITYYRGSLKNVALRLYYTAKKYRSNFFIRINGDSPLIDPVIINRAIDKFLTNKKSDIVTNVFPRTFPSGQSVEIIRTKIIKANISKMTPLEKEHVTSFFYSNYSKFKIVNFKNKNSQKYKKKIKLSVDRKSDLKKILKYFEND